MKNKILSIENSKLQEILNYVKEDSVFFYENMRLVSWGEILNYMNELNIEKTDIIPLIDLYDNDFVIYDIKTDDFKCINIVDEFIYELPKPIESYLELLKNK